jgi:hypothetical protein
MTINSQPFHRHMPAQLQIDPSDYGFLTHISFVDSSKFIALRQHDIDAALQARGVICALTQQDRERLKPIFDSLGR